MSSITILDTGFLKIDNTGTQLSSANRANSGSAITLNSVSVNFETKANVDDSPALGKYAETEVNFASFDNRKLVIKGVLRSSNSTEMSLVYPLHKLVQTKGYKTVYYPIVGDTTQLVSKMANGDTFSASEQSLFGIGGAYLHINIRFTSFLPQQGADSNIIHFTLEGLITA